jgi:mRNA interferase MazF
MIRGELYLVKKPGSADPKKQRVFVIVSRQSLINSNFSSVICAPVYSTHDDLETQVAVGIADGLKAPSSIHCDALVSFPKVILTNYIGKLSERQLSAVDRALAFALALPDPSQPEFYQ